MYSLWEYDDENRVWRCPHCGHWALNDNYGLQVLTMYCPVCGHKLCTEEEDENGKN